MKHNVILTVTSLLSIVFFSVHLADDIARGFEPGTLSNLGGVLIMVVWLYGTLMPADRASGRFIVFLASLLACGIPILHFSGAGVARAAKSDGGIVFVWTLLALGVTALYSFILSIRGIRDLRRTNQAGERT